MAEDLPEKTKVKISFYAKTDLARAVRATVYKHRLTLEQFFDEAARRELRRLEEEPPKEPETPPERLPRGRRIRPPED